MQTLAAIQLSNIITSDSVILKIPAKLKTSDVGKAQSLFAFKPFLDKSEFCVVSLIKFYLQVTCDLRQRSRDSFFLAGRVSHDSVSSQTLDRGAKTELNASGVDINIFSVHSTRHASTSLAASRSVV